MQSETKPMQNTSSERQDTAGSSVVYLSALMATQYADTCKRLTDILSKHNIPYAFLKGTKDIWCRDYMPVQTPSGKLMQNSGRYSPTKSLKLLITTTLP